MAEDLDWMEMLSAALVGVMRQIRHRTKGDQHKWAAPIVGGWERDIESSCAEKYVSKNLREYWFYGVNGATDVGPYQVRHTVLADGRLVLHPDDKDDEIFILTIGRAPTFEMIGWCYGREGKLRAYWEDPQKSERPAYFVPRTVVHRMDQLPLSPLSTSP